MSTYGIQKCIYFKQFNIFLIYIFFIIYDVTFLQLCLHMLVPLEKRLVDMSPNMSQTGWMQGSRSSSFCASQSSRVMPPLSELAANCLLASLLEMETK